MGDAFFGGEGAGGVLAPRISPYFHSPGAGNCGVAKKNLRKEICPGLNSSPKFTKTAKIRNYRNFRKIHSSC